MQQSGPNFEGVYGVTTNPMRLAYMMGTIWLLSQETKSWPLNVLEVGSWCGSLALTWRQAPELYNGGKGKLTCIDVRALFIDLGANTKEVSKEMDSALADEEPFKVFQHNVQFFSR